LAPNEPSLQRSAAAAEAPGEPVTFEQSLAELETIVHQLEDGELGLADALGRYEQGVKHLKRCYEQLRDVERKIELLTAVDENGKGASQPFTLDSAPIEDAAGRRRQR
jgi:exodeoxyribonuclease VII small subunit